MMARRRLYIALDLEAAEGELADAHTVLDELGVPRRAYDATLTVAGRLRWLQAHVPSLAGDVVDQRLDLPATERLNLACDLQQAQAERMKG